MHATARSAWSVASSCFDARTSPFPRGGTLRAEQELLELASRQYWTFTHAQAVGLHVPVSTISRRVADGIWRRPYRGVYAVPGASGTEQQLMAAQLACGRTAALSHRSAAWLYDLIEAVTCPEVTATDRGSRQSPTLIVYRTRVPEVHGRRGFRITTPMRTIVDLASCLDEMPLEQTLDRALNRGLIAASRLASYLDEPGNLKRAGTGALREMVAVRIAGRPLESVLETAFFRLLRKHGLPLPVPQYEVRTRSGTRRIDFAYVQERVAIELNGWSVHGTKAAFDADHVRTAELRALGWDVLPLTWEQIHRQVAEVALACGSALGLAPTKWRPIKP